VGTGEQTLTLDGLQATLGGDPGSGLPGGAVAGIGFLHHDPSAGPGWTVVKGGTSTADPDTLRGECFYRIAADPKNDRQLVAGTTKGLYLLPAGGSWRKIASYPSAVDMQPLDVVLTRLTGPDKVRIWVGVSTGVLVAEFTGAPATAINPASLVFRPVELANIRVAPALADGSPPGGTRVQLASDGAKVYVLGRRTAPDGTTQAHAWQIDATAAFAAAPAAALRGTELTGVPPDLFMSAGDQSSYDMCIAVHPTVAGRVYVWRGCAQHEYRLQRRDLSVRTGRHDAHRDPDRRGHAPRRPRPARRPDRAARTRGAHGVGGLRRGAVPQRLRRRSQHVRQPQRRAGRAAAGLRCRAPDQPRHRRRRVPGQRHRDPRR